MSDERRARLECIRKLRSQLDARWNEVTSLVRQASALELARDEVPWLLAEIERLTDENERLRAQLDGCQAMLDSAARR